MPSTPSNPLTPFRKWCWKRLSGEGGKFDQALCQISPAANLSRSSDDRRCGWDGSLARNCFVALLVRCFLWAGRQVEATAELANSPFGVPKFGALPSGLSFFATAWRTANAPPPPRPPLFAPVRKRVKKVGSGKVTNQSNPSHQGCSAKHPR